MASEQKTKISGNSPFAGCTILIVALAVMLFLVIFSVSVLFRQADAIEKFTEKEPKVLVISGINDRESELNQLAKKIETFRLAVEGEASARLELSAEELNLAIAAYDPFKDLRGNLRVVKITSEKILLDISFQLNGRPRLAKKNEGGWIRSDSQYLNGTMSAVPGLLNREIVLELSQIEVPGKKVAPEFVEQMSPYRIAERYVGTEGIGSVMSKITAMELIDGAVCFIKTQGEKPKDTITNREVDHASQRLFTFFGIAACIFLSFVAIVLFFALRLKKQKNI